MAPDEGFELSLGTFLLSSCLDIDHGADAGYSKANGPTWDKTTTPSAERRRSVSIA
jgi:hypothetical protein